MDMGRTSPPAYVVHNYTIGKPLTWRDLVESVWGRCALRIGGPAVALEDDGRDSLIGPDLFWRQQDATCGRCNCHADAMLSESGANDGTTATGMGVRRPGLGWLGGHASLVGERDWLRVRRHKLDIACVRRTQPHHPALLRM